MINFILFPFMFLIGTLDISSPSFKSRELIPAKYTCDGENISPGIDIKELPEGTKSLVLIVDDPDAPKGTFDHWVMWNIPPTKSIPENTVPGVEGWNGKGENKYTGPCPPSGKHHYYFKVYALDIMLDLVPISRKSDVESAMKDHILGQGELVGLYSRK